MTLSTKGGVLTNAYIYDYSKLLGRIREKGFTQKALAYAVNISEASLNLALNNKRKFKQDEIMALCGVLEIPISCVEQYFFCRKSLEI